MGISPDMEAWKARFALCLLIAVSALLLTGAREVTREWVRRDNHLAAVNREALSWVIPAPPQRTRPALLRQHPAQQVSLQHSRTWPRLAEARGTNTTQDNPPDRTAAHPSHLVEHALFLAQACARPVHSP